MRFDSHSKQLPEYPLAVRVCGIVGVTILLPILILLMLAASVFAAEPRPPSLWHPDAIVCWQAKSGDAKNWTPYPNDGVMDYHNPSDATQWTNATIIGYYYSRPSFLSDATRDTRGTSAYGAAANTTGANVYPPNGLVPVNSQWNAGWTILLLYCQSPDNVWNANIQFYRDSDSGPWWGNMLDSANEMWHYDNDTETPVLDDVRDYDAVPGAGVWRVLGYQRDGANFNFYLDGQKSPSSPFALTGDPAYSANDTALSGFGGAGRGYSEYGSSLGGISMYLLFPRVLSERETYIWSERILR